MCHVWRVSRVAHVERVSHVERVYDAWHVCHALLDVESATVMMGVMAVLPLLTLKTQTRKNCCSFSLAKLMQSCSKELTSKNSKP